MKKYIYSLAIVVVCYFIGESIYEEINRDKTPGKAKRLACQKEVTTFEKVYDTEAVIFFQKNIQKVIINLTSDIEKSIYTQSTLLEYISLEETNEVLKEEFLKYKNESSNDEELDYNIHYYIYENDADDPGKKNKKSKNYAGYILLEIKNNNGKLIYKIQMDFMKKEKSEIDKTIKCEVKSVMTIK